MGKLQVVVGGQFGSEAKGAVCAKIARNEESVACVRVAGPNAGHTGYDDEGRKWALRQIPIGAVTNPNATLVIAAGSEIDPEVLASEVRALDKAGHQVSRRLMIDAQATVLTPEHRQAEGDAALHQRIGSTGKGIGAARADRIWRRADLVQDRDYDWWCRRIGAKVGDVQIVDTAIALDSAMLQGTTVQVEGTQGFGLGLHSGFYPKCTSSDCRATDFLAMCGLSTWSTSVTDLDVFVVFRPFPIRVAGDSGPLEGETTWSKLGLPEERTTVTQLVRRVGTWDSNLAQRAIMANGGPSPFVHYVLSMADQVMPELAGCVNVHKVYEALHRHPLLRRIVSDLGKMPVLVGTGPQTMVDMRSMIVPQAMGGSIN